MNPDAIPLTRHARFAGSWYPRDSAALRHMISTAWDKAAKAAEGGPFIEPPAHEAENPDPVPRGLLLPHPGLAFGLDTQIRGILKGGGGQTPERVIILSPSHYEALPPDSMVSAPYAVLETPLARLTHRLPVSLPPGLSLRQEILDTEHGLESLLPLMSWLWPKAAYTLLVCPAAATGPGLRRMARLVRGVMEKGMEARTLLVASSDMSHCGWRFDDPVKRPSGMDLSLFCAHILERDRQVLASVGSKPLLLLENRESLAPTMCGLVPVLILQTLLGGTPVLLDQTSSLQSGAGEKQDPEDDTFVTYAAARWEYTTWTP